MADTRLVRLPRWQFSLRALLLLTALVGLGLTIYRWPWVETTEDSKSWGKSAFITTSFHRGWNGKPLHHGLRSVVVPGPRGHRDDMFFVDDQAMWCASYDALGKLESKHHFRGDEFHGPAIEENGALTGQYDNGDKSGVWSYRQGTTVIQQSFRENQQDGPWKWISDGHVVQTARFEKGRLVEWNGLPILEAFTQWCATNRVDPVNRAALQTPLDKVDIEHRLNAGYQSLEWPIRDSKLVLLIHNQRPKEVDRFDKFWGGIGTEFGRDTFTANWRFVDAFDNDSPAAPLIELLLKHAFIRERVPEYRFGAVSFVPFWHACPQEYDSTGVHDISFERDSPASSAWVKPFTEETSYDRDAQQRLRSLFAGTPLQVDSEQLPIESSPFNIGLDCGNITRQPRPRRDVLGLFLYSRGWSCRLRGDVIEILPRPKLPEHGRSVAAPDDRVSP